MKNSCLKYVTSRNRSMFKSDSQMYDIIYCYDKLFNKWTNNHNIIKIYRDED